MERFDEKLHLRPNRMKRINHQRDWLGGTCRHKQSKELKQCWRLYNLEKLFNYVVALFMKKVQAVMKVNDNVDTPWSWCRCRTEMRSQLSRRGQREAGHQRLLDHKQRQRRGLKVQHRSMRSRWSQLGFLHRVRWWADTMEGWSHQQQDSKCHQMQMLHMVFGLKDQLFLRTKAGHRWAWLQEVRLWVTQIHRVQLLRLEGKWEVEWHNMEEVHEFHKDLRAARQGTNSKVGVESSRFRKLKLWDQQPCRGGWQCRGSRNRSWWRMATSTWYTGTRMEVVDGYWPHLSRCITMHKLLSYNKSCLQTIAQMQPAEDLRRLHRQVAHFLEERLWMSLCHKIKKIHKMLTMRTSSWSSMRQRTRTTRRTMRSERSWVRLRSFQLPDRTRESTGGECLVFRKKDHDNHGHKQMSDLEEVIDAGLSLSAQEKEHSRAWLHTLNSKTI